MEPRRHLKCPGRPAQQEGRGEQSERMREQWREKYLQGEEADQLIQMCGRPQVKKKPQSEVFLLCDFHSPDQTSFKLSNTKEQTFPHLKKAKEKAKISIY
jgi:hypothetical protein